jgi:hypothetical protein
MPTCCGSTQLTPWTLQTQVPHEALAPQHLATQKRWSHSRQAPRSHSLTSGSATLAPPLVARRRQAQRHLQRLRLHHRHPQFHQQAVAHGQNQIRFRRVETARHTAWPTLTIACSVMVIGFTQTPQPQARRQRRHLHQRPHPALQVARVDR